MRTAGLILFTMLVAPAVAFLPADVAEAADLIDINTADAALLDTLPGIGPSKAAAIVGYRMQHGPFARIEDIQNVNGIGASTYANIAPLITVKAGASQMATATSSASSAVATSGAATYMPPPGELTVNISGASHATVGSPLHLSARAITKGGAIDPGAQITWSFGDGSSTSGREIEKAYRYTGTYLVIAEAVDGGTHGRDELTVTVEPAQVRIIAVAPEGITLANDSSERLDLSGWRLSADTGLFRMPNDTVILPKTSVLFSSNVTNLPTTAGAVLLYPDGAVAARVPSETPAVAMPAGSRSASGGQPALAVAGYEEVQAARLDETPAKQVDPIISIPVKVPAHEKAVAAPAAPTAYIGAAGAVFAATSSNRTGHASSNAAANLFKSPWVLGFLGVMALAGGAFIFL